MTGELLGRGNNGRFRCRQDGVGLKPILFCPSLLSMPLLPLPLLVPLPLIRVPALSPPLPMPTPVGWPSAAVAELAIVVN